MPAQPHMPAQPPKPDPAPAPPVVTFRSDAEVIAAAKMYFPHTKGHAVVGPEITCLNDLNQHTIISKAALVNRIIAGPPPSAMTPDPDVEPSVPAPAPIPPPPGE